MSARLRQDARERDQEILRRLDVLAEAQRFDVRPVVGAAPSAEGWLACRAAGREDVHPSATLNIGDGPFRGRYLDRACDEKSISFFDLAARWGAFPDWKAARDHFADQVELTKSDGGKGGRAYKDFDALVAAVIRGLEKGKQAPNGDWRLEAIHVYRDRQGQELYRVLKFRSATGEKAVRPAHQAAEGWVTKLPAERVLYNLPQVLEPPAPPPLLVVEGEKDADAAATIGYVATTNVGGAGKWRKADAEYFRDRHVVVICDNDDPGRKHGRTVAASLLPVAKSVRLVTRLPGVPEKGDLSDWVAAGGTHDALHELIVGHPRLTASDLPTEEVPPGAETKEVTNFVLVDVVNENGESEEKRLPKPLAEIAREIRAATGGCPCRVGDELFVPGADGKGVRFLRNAADLMAFIGERAGHPPHVREQAGFHIKWRSSSTSARRRRATATSRSSRTSLRSPGSITPATRRRPATAADSRSFLTGSASPPRRTGTSSWRC